MRAICQSAYELWIHALFVRICMVTMHDDHYTSVCTFLITTSKRAVFLA